MKRTIIAILLALVCVCLHAQELAVTSFKLSETDLTANLQGTTVLDQNGEKCALIKVVTVAKGLTFDVGVLGVRKVDTSHVGEIWVYVPYGVRKITISHPQYGQIRDYVVPENIEKARTYVMQLKVKKAPDNTQMLTVMYKPQNAIVVIDNKIMKGSNGVVNVKLPIGSHEYQVLAEGYDTENGTVNVKQSSPTKLVIELSRVVGAAENEETVELQEQASFKAEKILPITVNGVTFNMVYVEGGTFMMGATSEQGSDAYKDEKPAHSVTLSSYYIGQTEVTQALWKEVMGSNPSIFKGDTNPVEYVSWNDCQTFIQKLNKRTGKTFRLPTEAEWEYAARGGKKSRGYKYSGGNVIATVAWYGSNSGYKTHAVGTKASNELGIYDMSGNVWEWCNDRYGDYSSNAQTNPTGAESGSYRVNRGGSWGIIARFCRSSSRSYNAPSDGRNYLGLRLVLSE